MDTPKAFRAKACLVKYVVYLTLATHINVRSVWNWTYEPVGFQCDHPVDLLQPNNSKIKVLVYSLEKTGTTQVSRTLREFYTNTWHSEEFYFHLWAPHADEFWAKTEHGGGMWPFQRLATPGAPAYHSHSLHPIPRFHPNQGPADYLLFQKTTHEELAYKFQKCGTTTLTFDGFENAFWKVYESSPDAKVLILNWRPFEKWAASFQKHLITTFSVLGFINACNVGMYFLPWLVVIFPFMDWWSGNEITDLMKSGGTLLDKGSTAVLLMRYAMTERRGCQHWYSGFGSPVGSPVSGGGDVKAKYNQYWQEAISRIPAHRRMEFDVSKHTTDDLCKFLGLEGHPKCNSKPLPKDAPVLLAHEMEYPWSIPPTIPLFAFVHTVNYRICWGVLNAIGALLAKLAGKCGIRCRKKRKSKKA